MKKLFLLPIVFGIVLSACKEDSCSGIMGFRGITARNAAGYLTKNDPNDWTLKDHWSGSEAGLFNKTYKTGCVPSSAFSITVHPNPTTGPFQVAFNKTEYTTVDLRMVDDNCNIILAHDNIKADKMSLQAGNMKNGIVRLYYKFVEDGCEYAGHGDIQIVEAENNR
jgi:hypothetical protein